MAARGRLERLLCATLCPVARAKSMGVVASRLDPRVCGCIMEPETEQNTWRNGALDKVFRLPIHNSPCTRLEAGHAVTAIAARRRPRGRDVAQHEFGIRCAGDDKMHHEPIRHRSTRGVVPSYMTTIVNFDDSDIHEAAGAP